MRKLSWREHALNWLCFLFIVPVFLWAIAVVLLFFLRVLGGPYSFGFRF